MGVFAQMRMLDRLGLTVSWKEWIDTFLTVLERTRYALAPSSSPGRACWMPWRQGRGFRALFVIGMNETVFPRPSREDGFLRDRHRLILR